LQVTAIRASRYGAHYLIIIFPHLKLDDFVNKLLLYSDDVLISAGYSIKFWNYRTQRCIKTIPYRAVSILRIGKALYTFTTDDFFITRWNKYNKICLDELEDILTLEELFHVNKNILGAFLLDKIILWNIESFERVSFIEFEEIFMES
jgi:WD40 repeat protein